MELIITPIPGTPLPLRPPPALGVRDRDAALHGAPRRGRLLGGRRSREDLDVVPAAALGELVLAFDHQAFT